MKDSTIGIHAGEPKTKAGDPVVQPIYQSANYISGGEEESYEDVRYMRLNNSPNHETLHTKLAALEGAEDALVLGSGMAAISNALLALIPLGGELLAQKCLYGGTAHFLNDFFPSLGRKVRYFRDEDDLESLVNSHTKAIYVESISNPLLGVPDFDQVVSVAKKYSLLTLVDNTIPSPINFKPLSMGFDISLHSATKYLNGHSDIVAGAVIGAKKHLKEVRHLAVELGGSLDANACFLLNRGLKSLALRVERQTSSATKLAQALSGHHKIAKIHYPGLASHPDAKRVARYFKGAGGVLSFEFNGSVAQADEFIHRLELPKIAASLGGVESLITRPVTTSHRALSKEQLNELGIKDTLVRVSVGLEDPSDLVTDFLKALES